MEKYCFPSEELAVLESLPQALAVYQFVNSRVVTLAISNGFCDLFGYSDRDKAYYDMDNDMYQHTHPDDVSRIADAAVRFATEGGSYDMIYRTKDRRNPGYRMIHATGKHVDIETGVRLAYVWYTDEGAYAEDAMHQGFSFSHSLNQALYEDSMLKASHYDYLTGLPSMTYFFELATAAKAMIEQRGGNPVLLYIDFSGMKFFNMKYGYTEGNKLLQAFAKLLAQTFSNESCCHLNADHFAAFTDDPCLEDTLRRLFEDCRNLNNGNSLPVRVGIYSNNMEDVPAIVACDRAKSACDSLRSSYKSRFCYYNGRLQEEIEKRQYILSNLDNAISNKWIKVFYQPIVRAINGRVCAEEALARWIDPVKGFLSPADFIPYLEDASLIYKLDLCILDNVLEKIKTMQSSGLYIVPHSINLSRSDFETCDIVEEIRRRVDEAGLPRKYITIEITESIIGSNFDMMHQYVRKFQELGFPVWMDDFGSGYSSLDVLQTIRFDLLKFDMNFMQKLNEGTDGRIILTELMKMATALGVDTICEGVETEEQARFLQEIGCSMLQGYYYCKPIPLETILERYEKGIQIGFENPEESDYYESMGRVNLYDLAMIAATDDDDFQNFFNTLPMGIIEIHGDSTRFVRSNQSYRDFIKRFFGLNLSYLGTSFAKIDVSFMFNIVKTCCEKGQRAFYDEKMPDGSVVHSFARRIGVNPVNGNIAVAVAVLSIKDADEGTTYAEIARALAADYYNIYYVDLDTERFIEYSSRVGKEDLAIERHGDHFFAVARQDTMTRIYDEDREQFLTIFTKENILKELDDQGVFTCTYRLIDTGFPIYVNMKVTRMQPGSSHIIIGISIIDAQMKHQESLDAIRRERNTLTRVMALTENYLSLYIVDPNTNQYIEYTATGEYESLGFAKSGEDFFLQGTIDGKKTICPEDLPQYLQNFTKEHVLEEIRQHGMFKLSYRLMINGQERPVSLKIAHFQEGKEERLFAGVRAWSVRK